MEIGNGTDLLWQRVLFQTRPAERLSHFLAFHLAEMLLLNKHGCKSQCLELHENDNDNS